MSRNLVFALVALGLASSVAACAGPDERAAPPWRLVDAPVAADERHLIVTVAEASPGLLSAIAADLVLAHPVELVAEWPLSAIRVHCYVFRVEDGRVVDVVVGRLARDARVRTVQRMRTYVSAAVPDAGEDLSTMQGALLRLRAPEAHAVATGAGVRIGIVDTLPDADHPDLAGAIDDVRDFVSTAPDTPPEAHGTAVAGIIAARAEPKTGIVGVAPGASLVALRACWEEAGRGDRCSSFSVARALNVAILNELDVVNLSIAGPPDPLVDELLAEAATRGTVLVAAVGDDPSRPFPASSEHVLAVADTTAVRPAGLGRALRAPGNAILSTARGGGFDFFSGSSMAAALVSGVAALVRERAPEASPARVAAALDASARPETGVDACRSVEAIAPAGARCE